MKTIFLLLFALAATVRGRAQSGPEQVSPVAVGNYVIKGSIPQPPTLLSATTVIHDLGIAVYLTWSAPPSCVVPGAPQCSYPVWRKSVPAGESLIMTNKIVGDLEVKRVFPLYAYDQLALADGQGWCYAIRTIQGNIDSWQFSNTICLVIP